MLEGPEAPSAEDRRQRILRSAARCGPSPRSIVTAGLVLKQLRLIQVRLMRAYTLLKRERIRSWKRAQSGAALAQTSVLRRAVTRTATVLDRIGRPSRSYISVRSRSRSRRWLGESR